MNDRAVERTAAGLAARLFERRTGAGHWEGCLASSALSTATAVIALMAVEEPDDRHGPLIRAGLAWLAVNQNADGGWGDTVESFSNISTTALCWTALGLGRGRHLAHEAAEARAEAWLRGRIGGLSPSRLREAITQRYGKDRTLSVPILTVLALGGRLGAGDAWRQVPQLPFELAAVPHQLFGWLRLPVVSYALPALIALGQARHHQAPTRNPALRALRTGVRERTLLTLRSMQPSSGGFLEATPLTSFVVMSLAAAGRINHPVVDAGVRFLRASMRQDGAWPIDTNLSTWVTTLAINTVARHGMLSGADGVRVRDWLLAGQFKDEHPFTRAAPGGWAWTSQPGGVPDADDTAGAVLALSRLPPSPESREGARSGILWLVGLQNRDGGIPTFCRGWGALPFDRSAPDLTAHALEAWSAWHGTLDPALATRVAAAADRAVAYLRACQAPDGSWSPLWFGNQHVAGEVNPTYGTARVLGALTDGLAAASPAAGDCRRRAQTWLLSAQNADGGWGGGPGVPSSIEETGLALQGLARCPPAGLADGVTGALERGVGWMVAATGEGARAHPSPIGLYFARLWYFEELYPVVFGLGGLLAALDTLSWERLKLRRAAGEV